MQRKRKGKVCIERENRECEIYRDKKKRKGTHREREGERGEQRKSETKAWEKNERVT